MLVHRKEYEEFYTRWLRAKKEHPNLDPGPEPDVADFGFTTVGDHWEAGQIRKRLTREMNRNI